MQIFSDDQVTLDEWEKRLGSGETAEQLFAMLNPPKTITSSAVERFWELVEKHINSEHELLKFYARWCAERKDRIDSKFVINDP